MSLFRGLNSVVGLLLSLALLSCDSPVGQLPGDYPGETDTFMVGAPHVKSFGYYGSGDYIEDVKAYSNTIWMGANDWTDLAKTQADHLYAVIRIDSILFDSKLNLYPDYQARWDAFAAKLAPYNNSLMSFYLLDEPFSAAGHLGISDAVLSARINQAIKAIKSTHPSVPVSTIFNDSEVVSPNFTVPEGYDWVGLDCYGGFDLCDGLPVTVYYDFLKNQMNSDQRLIMVPQAMTFKIANPTPADIQNVIDWSNQYYTYTIRNSQVVAFWPFIWQTIPDVDNTTDYGANAFPAIKSHYADLMHLMWYNQRPEFDKTTYAALNGFQDSSVEAVNDPLYDSWINEGVEAGFRSSLIFDVQFYKKAWEASDASAAGSTNQQALDDWFLNGEDEAIASSVEFDPDFYAQVNLDVSGASGLTNYKQMYNHVLNVGIKEGRRASPVFDVNYYLNSNSDIFIDEGAGNYSGAWLQWLKSGISEGRRASLEFDAKYYIANNPSLGFTSTQYQEAMEHWTLQGLDQGLRASADFDVAYYLSSYPDLIAAFGPTNYRAALIHWINFGQREGRVAVPPVASPTPVCPVCGEGGGGIHPPKSPVFGGEPSDPNRPRSMAE